MSAEILVESTPGATVDLYLRFLQVQARAVQRRTERGWAPADELLVDGTRWIPYHEAVAQEIPLLGLPLDELGAGRELDVALPAGEDVEELTQDGTVVGRLVRTRWPLSGTLTLTTRPGQDDRLLILACTLTNTTLWTPTHQMDGASGERESKGSWEAAAKASWTPRDVAARYSFVGTHLLMTVAGTRFVSLLDGPDWAGTDTGRCTQSRCWPVLIADDAGNDAVLVAPIILGDHPSIAPESAGDLFDATEIDEILTLRIMTMTDEEKQAARGTDPRAAAILDRSDSMSEDILGRLHGARRDVDAVAEQILQRLHGAGTDLPPILDESDIPVYGEDVPWWDADVDARAEPTQDVVMVEGTPVSRGTRVLLRPSRRADAQDVFLAGQPAVVARVYFDVDGGTHLAVVLEDDPGRDLYDTTGRFYYFAPDEVRPLPVGAQPSEPR
jgi:hypothetical protein